MLSLPFSTCFILARSFHCTRIQPYACVSTVKCFFLFKARKHSSDMWTYLPNNLNTSNSTRGHTLNIPQIICPLLLPKWGVAWFDFLLANGHSFHHLFSKTLLSCTYPLNNSEEIVTISEFPKTLSIFLKHWESLKGFVVMRCLCLSSAFLDSKFSMDRDRILS